MYFLDLVQYRFLRLLQLSHHKYQDITFYLLICLWIDLLHNFRHKYFHWCTTYQGKHLHIDSSFHMIIDILNNQHTSSLWNCKLEFHILSHTKCNHRLLIAMMLDIIQHIFYRSHHSVYTSLISISLSKICWLQHIEPLHTN